MKNSLVNYGDGPRSIYEFLKKQIISGQLEAGSDLKIMPLASELGVSIVPVREAIRILASEDLVVLRPRRSPVIAVLDRRDLFEINGIRNALEPYVLQNAIQKHTAETLDVCEAILEKDAKSQDRWERVQLNQQFHLALLAPSKLKRTISIIEEQYVGIARIVHYRTVDYLAQHPDLVGTHHDEHQEILKATKSGDVELAMELMTEHIDRATGRARDLFDKPEQSEN